MLFRSVVPFPPGAASDFLARVLGQKLTEAWGQQIVVDNRPGAGGLIGGTVVAKATPAIALRCIVAFILLSSA